jgi:hypothetical protein
MDCRTGRESHRQVGGKTPLWSASGRRLLRLSEGCLMAEEGGRSIWSLQLPETFSPKCLLATETAVFAGGKGGDEKLWGWWLEDGAPIQVESPKLLRRYRKSIDDLFLWEDSLLAVDNLIHPKYLLQYREDAGSLRFEEKRSLESNGPQEHILRGVRSGSRLGILSATMHRAGKSFYATIYQWPSLHVEHSLVWHSLGPPGEPTRLTDLAFTDSALLLGTNLGVGCLPWGAMQESRLQMIGPGRPVISLHALPRAEGVVSVYSGLQPGWRLLPLPDLD